MNAFAAAVILSQISLHDFLALRADQRLQLLLPIPASMMVGTIIFSHITCNDGYHGKEQFNAVIVERRENVNTLVENEGDAY
jgi:hypothetical protein